MVRPVFLSIVLSLVFAAAFAQVGYPGDELPADTPKLFAKGILSDGLSNRDFTISPAGDEIFFTIQQPRFALSAILHLVKTDGEWGKPQVAPFSGKWRDLEAAFSPDGQYIYFSSDRPITGDAKKDFDIWRVRRLPGGQWSEAENLGPNVNSSKDEFYPSIAKSGNLYFTTEPENGPGSEDIVICKPAANGYSKPQLLPEDIDTKYDEFNAFVDPDEQFILFTSFGRADDMGRGDIYISHRDKNGAWLPVKHLPSLVNSSSLDYCPYVTGDKQYLIFTSNRLSPDFADGKTRNIDRVKALLSSPGNGLDDIYWVKFDPEWLK
jgi:dipeptidyl aminopeptidase/acylaminoacyl peptidase